MSDPSPRLGPPVAVLLAGAPVALAVVACVRPVRDALAHGASIAPPSQAFLASLAAEFARAGTIGAALGLALLLPWILRGGRPVARDTLARAWSLVVATGLWAVVGLRFNRAVAPAWLDASRIAGFDVPRALTDPGILGRNIAITLGAVVLAVVLTWLLRHLLPERRFPRPGRTLRWLVWIPFVFVAAAGPLRAALRPTPTGPDLILISLDAMRADRLGAYGGRPGLTPALDALAARSLVFERAYAQEPWTLTSHMSMFTGLYPDAHGLDMGRSLAPRTHTLAERLREAGYRTGASVYSCYWLSPDFGYAAGFDRYDEDARLAAPRVESAADWILADDRPTFFFLHLYDPHSDFGTLPYEASAEAQRRFAPGAADGFDAWTPPRGASEAMHEVDEGRLAMPDSLRRAVPRLYDAGVVDTDAALAAFFERLDAAGRLDDALVLVLADHGESLGDDGPFMHGTIRESTVRIPLILKLPGDERAGERVDGLVETLDVFPTFLAAAGLDPVDGDAPNQGRPLLDGPPRTFAFHRSGRDYAITTDDGWRIEYTLDENGVALQALRRVLGVAAQGPNVLPDSLHVVDPWIEPIQALHRANAALARPGEAGDVAVDEADLELLRSLGYIE